MAGLDGLVGFIPAIQDQSLGTRPGGTKRCGFAGASMDQTFAAGVFVELNSSDDVIRLLGRGPAVDQLLQLFEDGADPIERRRAIETVIYKEIDDSGGVAASTAVDVTGVTGSATAAVLGTPWLDRVYIIEVMEGGDIGVAKYRLCRNGDVIDTNHRVWEELKIFPITTVGPPDLSRIYLEGTGVAGDAYIEITEGIGADFVVGDIIVVTNTCVVPTAATIVTAYTDLFSYRDLMGFGIGGFNDITYVGSDRIFALDNSDWDEIHALITAEWDNNLHPCRAVLSVANATQTGIPLAYDITTWTTAAAFGAEDYRITQIATNGDIEGGIEVEAIWLLRPCDVDKSVQVMHQTGSILGQIVRGEIHWQTMYWERMGHTRASAVYPWNSDIDNLHNDGTAVEHVRTDRLSAAHLNIARARPYFARKIVGEAEWGMATLLSDFNIAPYYRILGAIHNELRAYYAAMAGAPGISASDADYIGALLQSIVINPKISNPSKEGDSVPKPLNGEPLTADSNTITVWAPDDAITTGVLNYSLTITPTGSTRQITGFGRLAP